MAQIRAKLRRVIGTLSFPFLSLFLFSPIGIPAPASDRVTLRGTVVNSIDGTPIRSALVQLCCDQPRAALTAANGGFEFPGLIPGDMEISVQKPGYFSAQEMRPNTVSERRVHLVLEMESITLRLFPEGIIFGRITSETGEGVEGLAVTLRRASAEKPRQEESSQFQTVTEENGNFRIAGLKPGSYLVVASKTGFSNQFPSIIPHPPSTRGYGTYFYPGVTDSASALPILITPGKQVKVDMRVEKTPYSRVSGRVTGLLGTTPISIFLIDGAVLMPVATARANPAIGDFILEEVPPGNYFLGGVQGGKRDAFGIVPIQVTHDLDSVVLPLAADISIPVRIKKEFTAASPAGKEGDTGPMVSFNRIDLPFGGMPTEAAEERDEKGVVTGLRANLEPGRFRVTFQAIPGQYVSSASSGSTDLLADDLVIAPAGSPEPVEIIARDDVASLQGKVIRGGEPAFGRVFLIPTRSPRMVSTAPVDSDGNFLIEDLAPGPYLAVALEDEEDADLANADMLRRIGNKGEPLNLEPHGRSNITLELKRLEP